MWDVLARRYRDQLAQGQWPWRYETGVLLKALWNAFETLGDEEFANAIEAWLQVTVAEDGTICGYSAEQYQLDHIQPGAVLLCAYRRSPQERYRLALDRLMEQLRRQPRTRSGGFWHKAIYPHQMWLDGLYMAGPVMVGYAREFQAGRWAEEALYQMRLLYAHALNGKAKLCYHGWDESQKERWADPSTGLSSQFWGRGMGWLAMALVDSFDAADPVMHARAREHFAMMMQEIAQGLARVQDPDSGLWWQVLDRPHDTGNYEEASASAMFVYAFAKGARLGILPRSAMRVAERGYQGILRHLVVGGDGQAMRLVGCNRVSGLGGSPYRDGSYAYYVQAAPVDDEVKSVAALIMAGSEVERT